MTARILQIIVGIAGLCALVLGLGIRRGTLRAF